MSDYDFQLIGSHPHAGKRVRLVPGDTPDKIQGMRVAGVFMALCEDEDGQRYYAERKHLAQVTITPLVPAKRKRGRR